MLYSNFYIRFYNWRQKLALAFRAFWRFRPSRYYLIIFALLQILAWWQSFFIFRHLSGNFLVLHYNINFGIDLVGNPSQVFRYPLYALIVLILNSFLAGAFYEQKNFKKFIHLLLSSALIFAVLINLNLLFIYLINFK